MDCSHPNIGVDQKTTPSTMQSDRISMSAHLRRLSNKSLLLAHQERGTCALRSQPPSNKCFKKRNIPAKHVDAIQESRAEIQGTSAASHAQRFFSTPNHPSCDRQHAIACSDDHRTAAGPAMSCMSPAPYCTPAVRLQSHKKVDVDGPLRNRSTQNSARNRTAGQYSIFGMLDRDEASCCNCPDRQDDRRSRDGLMILNA